MNKLISTFSLILSLNIVSAQSEVNIVLNGQGQQYFTLTDAFNFTAIHAGIDPLRGVFAVRIADQANETIAEAESEFIEMKQGEVRVGATLQWNDFKFGSNSGGAQLSQAGFLSAGEYIYCVSFRETLDGAVYGNACIELILNDFAGFQLVSPANESEICENPMLTWTPYLTPGYMDLRYSLRMVKVEDGQHPVEAIQLNAPVLETFDYGSTVFPLDVTLIKLEEKAQYAWQVFVWDKGDIIQKSEVWAFRYCDTKVDPPAIKLKTFQYLATGYGGGNILEVKDEINLAIDNRFGKTELNFMVHCSSLDSFQAMRLAPIALHEGLNFITLKLDSSAYPKGQRLFLESEPDEYGNKQYLDFIVK